MPNEKTRSKARRKLLQVAALSTGAVVLGACGTLPGTAPQDAAPADTATDDVRVIGRMPADGGPPGVTVADAGEDSAPGITVADAGDER